MNKDHLEKLKDIVNSELNTDKSLKSILKKYGIQKKDFNSINYGYNTELKQFVKVVPEVVPKVSPKNKSNITEKVTRTMTSEEVPNGKSNIMLEVEPTVEPKVTSEDKKAESQINIVDNDNKELLNTNDFVNSNLDVLAEMIKDYKKSRQVNENDIVIKLPYETKSNFKTSIRVNHVIWDKFKEFCNNNKQFKQVELISQALLDYMNKHNK